MLIQYVIDILFRISNKLLWLFYKNIFNIFFNKLSEGKLQKIKINFRYFKIKKHLNNSILEINELQSKFTHILNERDELLRFKQGVLGQYAINKLFSIRDYLEDDFSKFELDRLSMLVQGIEDVNVLGKFNINMEYYNQDEYLVYSAVYDKYINSNNFIQIGADWLADAVKYSSIYMSGYVFLPSHIQEKIKSDVFYDFGGFDGMGALIFSHVARKVYVFEPAKHFELLKENIKLAERKNVEGVNAGVSYEVGSIQFSDFEGVNEGASRLVTVKDTWKQRPTNVYDVHITTIDTFTQSTLSEIDKLGLMKFDIEGAEYDAIQGGLDTIRKYKPVLLISIYHNGKDMLEIINVIRELNIGYKFMLRNLSLSLNTRFEWILMCYVD